MFEYDSPSGVELTESHMLCAGFVQDWSLPKGPNPEPRMPKSRRPGLW